MALASAPFPTLQNKQNQRRSTQNKKKALQKHRNKSSWAYFSSSAVFSFFSSLIGLVSRREEEAEAEAEAEAADEVDASPPLNSGLPKGRTMRVESKQYSTAQRFCGSTRINGMLGVLASFAFYSPAQARTSENEWVGCAVASANYQRASAFYHFFLVFEVVNGSGDQIVFARVPIQNGQFGLCKHHQQRIHIAPGKATRPAAQQTRE